MIIRQRQLMTELTRFTRASMERDRGLYVATVIEPLVKMLADAKPRGDDETDYDRLKASVIGPGIAALGAGRPERVERLAMRSMQAAAIGEVWQLGKLQRNRSISLELGKDEDRVDEVLRRWLQTGARDIGVTQQMLRPASSMRTLRRIIGKTVLTSDQFDRLLIAMRANAFRVWTLNDLAIVQSIRDQLVAAVDEGRSFRTFWNGMNNTLREAGQPDRPFWHASTIYQNNVSAAFSDAKNAIINTKVARRMFPYRRYMTRNNARVRPTHRALHGLVFAADDPFWEVHDPPWEHNCRCFAEVVTQKEQERRGYRISSVKDVRKRGVEPSTRFSRTGSTVDAGTLDDDLAKQLDREIERREKGL